VDGHGLVHLLSDPRLFSDGDNKAKGWPMSDPLTTEWTKIVRDTEPEGLRKLFALGLDMATTAKDKNNALGRLRKISTILYGVRIRTHEGKNPQPLRLCRTITEAEVLEIHQLANFVTPADVDLDMLLERIGMEQLTEPDRGRIFCIWIYDGQKPNPQKGYIPSVVYDGEVGHHPLCGDKQIDPWYWGPLEVAKELAKRYNEALGLTQNDVALMVAKAMSRKIRRATRKEPAK